MKRKIIIMIIGFISGAVITNSIFSLPSKLQRRKGVGVISNILNPGYSWCSRCYISWGIVDGHTIWYDDNKGVITGVFTLCEECWNDLTPEERLPFYLKQIDKWESKYSESHRGKTWDQIRADVTKVVMEGE